MRQPGAIACKSGADLPALRRLVGPQFEVQDIASQAVGKVCGPKVGDRWWDVCAGAGGKSLHLADLMQDKGEIIATDLRNSALRELEKRARIAGFSSIRTHAVATKPTGLFDGVLVDAPCSGIGTWARNADMRWRTEAKTVADKALLQLKLLDDAAASVRPGGRLVFAVCTVTEPETVGVVRHFQEKHPEFMADPFLRWDSTMDHVWTIWPWEGPGGGMFIARFRRVE
jgi:16S rRNA (cytosine967-C5)-methyltransferase